MGAQLMFAVSPALMLKCVNELRLLVNSRLLVMCKAIKMGVGHI